ncbi:MAG: hypothetical protein Q9188_002868 [Gyalolechia gomerana]
MPIITPAITTVFAFQLAGWAYHPPDGDQTCLGYLEESEHREVMGQASGLYGIFPPVEWESEAPFDCTVLIEWSGSVILIYYRRIETVFVSKNFEISPFLHFSPRAKGKSNERDQEQPRANVESIVRQFLLPMKAFRLLRWSGSVLSPRTRPCGLHHFYKYNPPTRFLSAMSPLRQAVQEQHQSYEPEENQPEAELTTEDDAPIIPEEMPAHLQKEARLRALPSPPLSEARSSAKLAALHARLSLSPRLPIETLARCLVDETADRNPDFNNTSLSILGRELYGYYTSEAILCRYPRLPTAVVFAAMSAYVGRTTLTQITKEWGVELVAEPGGEVDPGYLQCKREDSMLTKLQSVHSGGDSSVALRKAEPKIVGANRPNPEQKTWRRGVSSMTVYDDEFGDMVRGETDKDSTTTVGEACARFVQAVMGAVYLHRGRHAAKTFFKEHILSRYLEIGSMFDFKNPTRDLSKLCAREGFERPVARILSETGRLSRHPVFNVGVFAGRDKLGEGTGSSLDEARIRAAVGALKGWYLYSPLDMRVPSDAEGPNAKPWKPVLIDIGEVVV